MRHISSGSLPLLLILYSLYCVATFVGQLGVDGLLGHHVVTSRQLVDKARTELAHAVEGVTSSRSGSPMDVARYEEVLRRSNSLFGDALGVAPLDTRAIHGLAVVAWELSFVDGEPDTRIDALMELATARAPQDVDVLSDSAELLLRMNRSAEAIALLSRVVSIAPSRAQGAVAVLEKAGMQPADIAAALPHDSPVLSVLSTYFFMRNEELQYLTLVEPILHRCSNDVLRAYGEAALRRGNAERLVQTLSALSSFSEPEREATRQRYLARGHAVLKNSIQAVAAIRLAEALTPDDPAVFESAGEVFRLAGDHLEAESAYVTALRLLALGDGLAATRARVYAALGRTLEAGGRVEEAIDAYRRAMDLAPQDPIARQRLEELKAVRPSQLR